MKCRESGNTDSMSYMRIHIWLGNPQKRIHLIYICVLFQMWCSMQPRRSKPHSIGTRFCQCCRPKCCILGVVELEFLKHPFFRKGNNNRKENKLIWNAMFHALTALRHDATPHTHHASLLKFFFETLNFWRLFNWKGIWRMQRMHYLERDVPRVFPTRTNIPRNVNGDKVLPDIARLSTLWDASN